MPTARLVFYAATLGGLLFAAHAILTEPPALWLAAVVSSAYAGVMLAGVFVLRLRMYADAVVRGPKNARGVVLTFDDGPDPIHTRRILDILDEHGAVATFFVIGRKVEAHPDVVREIVARGHEVGIHGFAHDRLFALRGGRRVRRDLERAVKTLEKVTQARPQLFRPPIGHTNPAIARIADQLDLTVVGWSSAGYDGLARAEPKAVAHRITQTLDDRQIILLHDAAERDDHTPAALEALPLILAAMKDKNLRVVPLRSWIDVEG